MSEARSRKQMTVDASVALLGRGASGETISTASAMLD
jgi:hypothetical protein